MASTFKPICKMNFVILIQTQTSNQRVYPIYPSLDRWLPTQNEFPCVCFDPYLRPTCTDRLPLGRSLPLCHLYRKANLKPRLRKVHLLLAWKDMSSSILDGSIFRYCDSFHAALLRCHGISFQYYIFADSSSSKVVAHQSISPDHNEAYLDSTNVWNSFLHALIVVTHLVIETIRF